MKCVTLTESLELTVLGLHEHYKEEYEILQFTLYGYKLASSLCQQNPHRRSIYFFSVSHD